MLPPIQGRIQTHTGFERYKHTQQSSSFSTLVPRPLPGSVLGPDGSVPVWIGAREGIY